MKDVTKRKKRVLRSENRDNQSAANKTIYYVGILVFGVGFLMWIGETRNDYRYDNTMFWISFFVMTTGLIMVYFSSRKNLMIANYNQYYDMIYQNEMFTISALAEYSDKPRAQVVQELQLLISQGYLKNIRVSQTENEIAGAFVTTVKEQVKRKTVRCGGCGATNEVAEHVTTECEYCGRKLTFHNH